MHKYSLLRFGGKSSPTLRCSERRHEQDRSKQPRRRLHRTRSGTERGLLQEGAQGLGFRVRQSLVRGTVVRIPGASTPTQG